MTASLEFRKVHNIQVFLEVVNKVDNVIVNKEYFYTVVLAIVSVNRS